MRAGVRMAWSIEVSVDYFPSQWWTPRQRCAARPRQMWEVRARGVEARKPGRPAMRAWMGRRGGRAHLCRALGRRSPAPSPPPKPVGRRAPSSRWGAKMSNDSLRRRTTQRSTLAYVLARTARATGSLSVLDWGGAPGTSGGESRGVRCPRSPSIGTSRELPAVSREGRLVSPSVTFHESR